jgi:hypothetical protein
VTPDPMFKKRQHKGAVGVWNTKPSTYVPKTMYYCGLSDWRN